MAKEKPFANEPGRYVAKQTEDGWVLVIDYALRLAKGGGKFTDKQPDGVATDLCDPWAIWHPTTDTVIGYGKRKDAVRALDVLCAGIGDGKGFLDVALGSSQTVIDNNPVIVGKDAGNLAPARPREEMPAEFGKLNYSREFMRALQSNFPPELLCERLEEQMTACTFSRSGGLASYVPDWSARQRGIELAIAYIEGRPIERQQIMQSNAPMSWEAILGLANSSPVFRDTLLGMLTEIAKTSKDKPQ